MKNKHLPAILRHLHAVQPEHDDGDVMRTAIAVGCLLLMQAGDSGGYSLCVSPDFLRRFPESADVFFVHTALHGTLHLADELCRHIDSGAEPSVHTAAQATRLGRWALTLATLVGEGHIRLITELEAIDEEPNSLPMAMLESLYDMNRQVVKPTTKSSKRSAKKRNITTH